MDTNRKLAQPKIHVLKEINYDSRVIRMRTILCSQYIWEFVTVGYTEPIGQATKMALTNAERILLKENRKKENKSFILIQQGLTETIFLKV